MDRSVKSEFITEYTTPNHNIVLNSNEADAKKIAEVMNLQLTPQELKILKECQHDAVSQRGLPAAAISFGGVYYFMKSGKIATKNPWLLVSSAVTGFLIGTMSYRSVCMEKLLALPESTLKERILQAQGRRPQVKIEVPAQDSGSWFDSMISTTDVTPMESSLNVETHQSQGFDDISSNRIDLDTHYAVDPPLPAAASSFTTYDDLRRKNREQYIQSQNNKTPNRMVGEILPEASLKQPQPYPSDPYYDLSQRSTSDDFLR